MIKTYSLALLWLLVQDILRTMDKIKIRVKVVFKGQCFLNTIKKPEEKKSGKNMIGTKLNRNFRNTLRRSFTQNASEFLLL